MKTSAADRFISDVIVSWTSREPWEDTARQGLSDVDEDTLRSFCEEASEDYGTAEDEVLKFIRARVARIV